MHPFVVHVRCSRELVCPDIDCHAAAADILLTPRPPVKITRRAAAEILTSAQGSSSATFELPQKIFACWRVSHSRADTIRYDTRCYFNVRSKADISRLNLPHGNDN